MPKIPQRVFDAFNRATGTATKPNIHEKNVEVNEGIQSLLTRGFARSSRYKIEIEPSKVMRERLPFILANDGMIPTGSEVSSAEFETSDGPGSVNETQGTIGLEKKMTYKTKSFEHIDNQFLRELNFNCEFVSLPGATFSTSDDPLRIGPTKTFPVLQTFERLVIGFISSANMQEFRFFKAWQELIINKKTHVVGYYNDYFASVTISQLDLQDKVSLKMKVKEIYPIQITPIALSYSSGSQVSKFTVSFARR
jgi:hypothetical protein